MGERRLLIGLDDTDNADSRGTGHQARSLAWTLAQAGFGRIIGVTRHQLLVDDAIPYTSHNSCACVSLDLEDGAESGAVMDLSREFLLGVAAEGSDVGLCVATVDSAERIREFGRAAQTRVLRREQAEQLARQEGIALEGLTGDHLGTIGALAAVGLHSHGDDGRYLWIKGIRELEEETVSVGDLALATGLDVIRTLDGLIVDAVADKVRLGPWPRPIRDSGKATLLVEKNHAGDSDWKVLDKDAIKAYRP